MTHDDRPAPRSVSLTVRLGIAAALLTGIPAASLLAAALLPGARTPWLLPALAACAAAGGAAYAWYAQALYARRIGRPLERFRATLENISEGFIDGELPAGELGEAEPELADAFRQVIRINRLLLRNVEHMEQGYEQERQAKLAQLALTRAYQRFVPQDFISFLQKSSITEVDLGDHVRTDMTILVSDIRSFTTLSERMTPEDNFKLINAYLTEMEPAVHEQNGFIDKYMGDAVMALFHRSPDHAVRAAIGMLRRLQAFNARRAADGEPELAIGIGLNTGSLMLGIVGGRSRMEGTVISDAVNIAARVEDLTKTYGVPLLITEQTYAGLADPGIYAVRPIDRVQVKGRARPVTVYEVFDADPEPARARKTAALPDFEAGWRHWMNGEYAQALIRFRRCAELDPHDGVVRLYAERCAGAAAAIDPLSEAKAGDIP